MSIDTVNNSISPCQEVPQLDGALLTRGGAAVAPGRSGNRIQAMDVTRGAAMLLVFLSHFSGEYIRPMAGRGWHAAQGWLTVMATPAFVLVSGMMLGLLCSGRGDYRRVRDKLIDRGLFLLIVGRPVIALAHVALDPDWRTPFFSEVFITDTVAVSLILGAIMAEYVDAAGRLRVGFAVLVVGWALDILWIPDGWGASLCKEMLFGRLRGESLIYNFPLLPWFGVYLVGSALSEIMARTRAIGGGAAAARFAFRASGIGLAMAFLVKLGGLPLKYFFSKSVATDVATVMGRLTKMLAVGQKLPPGLTFLFFYGAIALGALGVALRWEARIDQVSVAQGTSKAKAPWAWRCLAMLGRNSLIAFVLQFYVYFTIVHLLPKPSLIFGPAYFVATVAVLLALTAVADRYRLNQHFSVGFARWAGRRRERASVQVATSRYGR